MPSKLVQVELPTGDLIWAWVAVDGPTNVASGVLQKLDVEDLRKTVRGVSTSLPEAVNDLVPDAVQVEFGLELALKSGKLTSVLAEAGATASVKVTLTWNGADLQSTGVALGSVPVQGD
ncbi:hypothetical protein KBX71_18410 [Micromonospora sp. D93]|uniref:CU044_2847 family protein n=1 Tax=Micromonospora sp. D93 TaxID=2824886 RepID=UPI001B377B54|nr:CU044_2847 family protein [Micromonospora sp. D93]MBQ1019821.1 hypothetical protein [Micromonospora sp. D93]